VPAGSASAAAGRNPAPAAADRVQSTSSTPAIDGRRNDDLDVVGGMRVLSGRTREAAKTGRRDIHTEFCGWWLGSSAIRVEDRRWKPRDRIG
jgi:hypothetical protein